jgi:uncharacterized membrane protein
LSKEYSVFAKLGSTVSWTYSILSGNVWVEFVALFVRDAAGRYVSVRFTDVYEDETFLLFLGNWVVV